MDTLGSSDPYCELVIGDHKEKTAVKKRKLNPVWNESFTFGLREETITGELLVRVYDWEAVGHPHLMGEIHVPISDVMDKNSDKWYDLTGTEKAKGSIHLQLHAVRRETEGMGADVDVNEASDKRANEVLQQALTVKEYYNQKLSSVDSSVEQLRTTFSGDYYKVCRPGDM